MPTTDNGNLDPFSIVDTEAEEVGVQRIVDRTVDWEIARERDVLTGVGRGHRCEPHRIYAGVTRFIGFDGDKYGMRAAASRPHGKFGSEIPNPPQAPPTSFP